MLLGILTVLFFIGVAMMILSIFMLIRNEWVYRVRMDAIDSGDWNRLPDYDTMMWKFWVWDIKKFYVD